MLVANPIFIIRTVGELKCSVSHLDKEQDAARVLAMQTLSYLENEKIRKQIAVECAMTGELLFIGSAVACDSAGSKGYELAESVLIEATLGLAKWEYANFTNFEPNSCAPIKTHINLAGRRAYHGTGIAHRTNFFIDPNDLEELGEGYAELGFRQPISKFSMYRQDDSAFPPLSIFSNRELGVGCAGVSAIYYDIIDGGRGVKGVTRQLLAERECRNESNNTAYYSKA